MADADYSSMSPDEYRALMAQQASQMAQPQPVQQPSDDGTGFKSDVFKNDVKNAIKGIGHVFIPPGLPGGLPYIAPNAAGPSTPNAQAPVAAPVNQVPEALQRPSERPSVPDASLGIQTYQNQPQQLPVASQGYGYGNPYAALGNEQKKATQNALQGIQTAQSDYDKALKEKQEATHKEAEYNAQLNDKLADIQWQSMQQQQERQATADIDEANRRHDVEIEMNKYQSIANDFLNSKVDPDAGWKHGLFGDNMTGNKIVAAIGLLVSGLGGPSAVQNTNNMINTAINRDIALQKEAIDRKGQASNMQLNIVGQYRQVYRDQVQADLAAKMALQEHAIQVMEYQKQSAKGQQDLNSADSLIAGMKQEYAKTQMEFLKTTNDVVKSDILNRANIQNLGDDNATQRAMLAAKLGQTKEKLTPQQAKVYDELVKIKNGMDTVHAGAEKYKNATSGIGESIKQFIPGTDAYDYRQFANASAGEMAPGLFPGTRQNAYTEQRSRDIIPGMAEPLAKGKAVYGEKIKEGVQQMRNRIDQLKAMHAPQSVIDEAESMTREFGQPESETRQVNGHTYVKTKGGWQLMQ